MSLINFGGLATGIDTNALLEQLVALERLPQVRVRQRQELLRTREDAFRDVNSRLLNLKNAAKALSETSLFKKVSTITSSDATAVTGANAATGTPVAGAYAITTTQLARNEIKTQGSAITQAASADTLSFSLDGGPAKTVLIGAGDTLATIASKINTAAVGVNAVVVDGKLRLDAAAVLTVSDGDGGNGYNLAADLGFTTTQTHQKAQFTVDGTAYTRSTNTVGDVIAGVSFTVLKLGSATLTVSQPAVDTAALKKKIEDFVAQYNSTYSLIRDKVKEKKVVPAETTADQLKGALQNDLGLNAVMRDLRRALADAVSGLSTDYDELREIGVSTGGSTGVITQTANDGTLVLDSAKLDAALAANPQAVQDVLQRVGANSTEHGLVRRVSDIVDPLTQAGGVLGSRMDGYAAERKRLDDRLVQMEQRVLQRERVWRAQFTAMEKLVASYRQSSAALGGFG